MPGSRGDRPAGSGRADRAAVIEWETATFDTLRRHRDASTIFDDELPDDPLADLDETRSALRRLYGA